MVLVCAVVCVDSVVVDAVEVVVVIGVGVI